MLDAVPPIDVPVIDPIVPPPPPLAMAAITVADVTTASPELMVTVVYTADAKVAVNSVDPGDLVVSPVSPDASQSALVGTAVAVSEAVDASPLMATYILTAPGGEWDAIDNGTWQVSLASGAVLDTVGTLISGSSTSFKVEVPAPPPPPPASSDDDDDDDPDRRPPTAEINVGEVKAGAESLSVVVKYTDDREIDRDTIGPKDLKVTGPNGKSLNISLVDTDSSKSGREVTATYEAKAPGGQWDHADNGNWIATIINGAVRDEAGLSIDGVLKDFTVAIDPPASPPPPVVVEPTPEPEPAANDGPTVSVAPLPDITAAGNQPYTISVTYRDSDGVNPSTIGPGDLRVVGPKGAVDIADVQFDGPADARTAVYTLQAPGGSWDAADAGTYQVTVRDGAVADVHEQRNAELQTSFDVSIAAAAPVIDGEFSGGAPVSSGFVAEAAVTLEDGRIVIAGRQGNLADGSSRGVLKRLNADGSVDRTFGDDGLVRTTGGNAAYYALTVLADGSLLAAGQADGDVLVQHYKANGALNTIFGGGGKATVDWGAADDTAYGIATTADGRIVVGGGTAGSFGFSRFTVSGEIDTFFGTLGSSLFQLGSGNNTIGAIAIQADGKIVGVGSVGGEVAVLRLTENGDADATFGVGGAMTPGGLSTRDDLGSTDYTMGLAVQPDGRIVVANRSNLDFAVTRLLPSGEVDTSFGSGGRTTIDFGGDDDTDAVVVQNTGDILVVGTTTLQGGRIAVAALHSDGTINTGFGENGRLTLDSGLTDSGRALHVGNLVLRAFAAARGNQVVVGGSEGGSNAVSSSGLRRLNVPGSGLLGRFGAVDGKNKKLRFIDSDGTVITLNLKGGSGQAYYDGSSVDLVLSGVNDNSRLKVNTAGGDGRLRLRNVKVDGALKNITAPTADLTGTFWVGGNVSKLSFGTVGGTIAASGSIGTLLIGGNADRATVLAGAHLGSDYRLGGTGASADTFSTASINKIDVRGEAIGSLFGAGLNRGNNVFLDNDDTVEGGDTSRINLIRVRKGIDATTRFVAGFVGKVRTSTPIDLAEDDRFVVL